MLPPSKTLFVLPKEPNVCDGPPSTAFGLSSNCILFLGGLPPKDCNVSKFTSSGLLFKLPFPWSPPLPFGWGVPPKDCDVSKFIASGLSKLPCPWSTPLTFGLFLGRLPPKDYNFSLFISSGLLSKFPCPWSTLLTFSLFLGELPPKDCNVSKFIASGLSKFPCPWSTPYLWTTIHIHCLRCTIWHVPLNISVWTEGSTKFGSLTVNVLTGVTIALTYFKNHLCHKTCHLVLFGSYSSGPVHSIALTCLDVICVTNLVIWCFLDPSRVGPVHSTLHV